MVIKIIFYIIAYLVVITNTIYGDLILAGIWMIIILLNETVERLSELNTPKSRKVS